MNTDMLVLLLIFQNMSCYCQMISWMQNANSFRMSKVQSQDIAQYLLDFCQFQPGVANKSVAYRKKKRNEAYFRKASLLLRVSHNTSIQIKLFILPLKKIVEKQLIIAYPRGEVPLLKNLISRAKCPQEITSDKPPLPKNSLQGMKLLFRKFRLYFRSNMIG